MRSVARGTCRQRLTRTLRARTLDPLRTESAAPDRGLSIRARLGLEGSAQQLDAAVLARPAAGFENADHRAQSVGSRLFDARSATERRMHLACGSGKSITGA